MISIMDYLNEIQKDSQVTEELKVLLEYVKRLANEYPTNRITIDYLIFAMFENTNCTAYAALSSVMFSDTIMNMYNEYKERIISNTSPVSDMSVLKFDIKYVDIMTNARSISKEIGSNGITSGHVLLSLIKNDGETKDRFLKIGVDYNQISNKVAQYNKVSEKEGKKDKVKKKKGKLSTPQPSSKHIETPQIEESGVTYLNRTAGEGQIDHYIGGSEQYETIFSTMMKKNRNNVLIVGESGVGKTALVKNIANMLYENEVPEYFQGFELVSLDFMSMIIGTPFRGGFEGRFKNIVNAASKAKNIIFFVDDIHSILSDKSHFGEVDIITTLKLILDDVNIHFIATTNNKAYKEFFDNNNQLKTAFNVINIEEPTIDDSIAILDGLKSGLEMFHGAKFDADFTELCVKVAKRYITDGNLPATAIDLMDFTAAKKRMTIKSADNFSELREKIDRLEEKKAKLQSEVGSNPTGSENNGEMNSYDLYDEAVKELIAAKNELSKAEKMQKLTKKSIPVTKNDLLVAVSAKTGIDITEISFSERDKLRNLEETIKKSVVGQDEAVNEVCKVVKRQRIGFANPNKPATLFFAGSSGCGKTLLAKKIALNVFGSEKCLIRLDMSEYADSMSSSKLTGSSPGYIGFDRGGTLTEAVKKKKQCVLLLDEIEKAHDNVFNIFLQLFDEGRLTDGGGTTVDFKNVIVIMTSNIGAQEMTERGGGVGFTKNEDEMGKMIFERALKSKFKPEFINRIDKIVFFNKLSDNNLENIVDIEIDNALNTIADNGYAVNKESFHNDELKKTILDECLKDKKYGARPIVRSVQKNLTDVLMEVLLERDIDKTEAIDFQFIAKKLSA